MIDFPPFVCVCGVHVYVCMHAFFVYEGICAHVGA